VGTNASTGTGLQGSPLRENTASAPPNRVLDVSEKGPRGFVVQTVSAIWRPRDGIYPHPRRLIIWLDGWG
jgi:hypothetical protein